MLWSLGCHTQTQVFAASLLLGQDLRHQLLILLQLHQRHIAHTAIIGQWWIKQSDPSWGLIRARVSQKVMHRADSQLWSFSQMHL